MPQSAQNEKSDAQREHEIILMDKNFRLEELRFRINQLESDILKTQGGGGGGSEKLGLGASAIHLFTTLKEDDYFVHGAFNWGQWVKRMVNIRERPRRWDAERIFRQFTEALMKGVIVSLQRIRSSSSKPFPARLVGFDTKVEGRYTFFTLPDFADVIESYLRVNDKEKDGKAILISISSSVTTDSFSRHLETTRPRAAWRL